jgi:hypothetical protein
MVLVSMETNTRAQIDGAKGVDHGEPVFVPI